MYRRRKAEREERVKKKREKKAESGDEALRCREHKGKTMVYVVLRVLVVVTLIAEVFNDNWNNVFFCVLTLVLFMIPTFIDKRLHIELPNTLEIIILLFIFAAEILGELNEYYLHYPNWDDMLHTMNGFLAAAIGLSLIDILNRSDRFAIHLSPVFVALVAFCFSMTIGVLWEFFEFGMDYFTHTDMQKDTVLTSISSVLLNPEGRNAAVTLPIESVVVNGQPWNYGGYIDIGLYDTMSDLFVNFIGAAVFSVIGIFYIKGRGKGSFAKRFIPTMKSKAKIERDKALEQARKEKVVRVIETELERLTDNGDEVKGRLEQYEEKVVRAIENQLEDFVEGGEEKGKSDNLAKERQGGDPAKERQGDDSAKERQGGDPAKERQEDGPVKESCGNGLGKKD